MLCLDMLVQEWMDLRSCVKGSPVDSSLLTRTSALPLPRNSLVKYLVLTLLDWGTWHGCLTASSVWNCGGSHQTASQLALAAGPLVPSWNTRQYQILPCMKFSSHHMKTSVRSANQGTSEERAWSCPNCSYDWCRPRGPFTGPGPGHNNIIIYIIIINNQVVSWHPFLNSNYYFLIGKFIDCKIYWPHWYVIALDNWCSICSKCERNIVFVWERSLITK